MDTGSTTLAENLPPSNIFLPKDQHDQSQSEIRLVSVQAVSDIRITERNTSLSQGDQQGRSPRSRPNSGPFCGPGTNSRSNSSQGSVNSNINYDTIGREDHHNQSFPDENGGMQRRTGYNTHENPVSPVRFVHKWLETRSPWDESSAQLRRSLSAAIVKNHNQQSVIPDNKLEEIVEDYIVRMELEKSNYSNFLRIRTSPVTAPDVSQYRKILAILYLIKLPSKIRKFVKYGICDKHLPLVPCESSKKKGSSDLRSAHDDAAPTIRFKRGDYRDDFLQNQWSVLAPIFPGSSEDSVVHSKIKPESFLPFISHEIVTEQGGYSDVYKTKIIQGHHEFGDAHGNVFAIKELKTNDKKAFDQEAAILRRLSNPRHAHKHLIVLLATFECDKAYHFIFPWAEADLFQFWKRQEDPPNSDYMGTWIIQQCRGLADGLNTIHRYATMSGTTLLDVHDLPKQVIDNEEQQIIQPECEDSDHPRLNLFGRHGDVKPENILWFPSDDSPGNHGVLKITDFGTARFNTVNLWDTHKTGRIPNSATYRSPEIDLHGKLTTACDIWALGCVYLQFITWYFGGNKCVQEFGHRRLAEDPKMFNMRTDTFFTLFQAEGQMRAKVKPTVLESDHSQEYYGGYQIVLAVFALLRKHRKSKGYGKIQNVPKTMRPFFR